METESFCTCVVINVSKVLVKIGNENPPTHTWINSIKEVIFLSCSQDFAHVSSHLSPTGSCTRQRNCHPTLLRLTTRTWTRMRSVMTIFLTNAFPIRALHTGCILSRTLKSVYRSLKAVKIYFAGALSSQHFSGTLFMNGILRCKVSFFTIDPQCLADRGTNGDLIGLRLMVFVLYRIPPHCHHPKGEVEAAEEEEEAEGSVCFGPAGSTRGTSTALSTIASLCG